MAPVQRGTGYHIDVDPGDPFRAERGRLRWRPFQSLLALSDQAPGDASLEVVPGFHRACADWYRLTWRGAARAVGEWGFSVVVNRTTDRPLIERARRVGRIPEGWEPAGLPAAPTGFDTPQAAAAWVERCRAELDGLPRRPLRAGDFALWDPRMVHANGAANTSEVIRRCMYCAYVPAIDAHQPLRARILNCRRLGAPGLETRSGAPVPGYTPTPLEAGSLGERLYGLSGWPAPAIDPALASDALVGEREIAFFSRYGFVVIEGLLERADVAALNAATERFIQNASGVDPSDPRGTLTAARWRKVGDSFGGMLQVQWLPEMESVRLDPRPYRATAELLAATWARGAAPFDHPLGALDPWALWAYPDRQNFRWPDATWAQIRG